MTNKKVKYLSFDNSDDMEDKLVVKPKIVEIKYLFFSYVFLMICHDMQTSDGNWWLNLGIEVD